MSDQVSGSIAEQPPSAKLVYIILKHRGPQTQKQLIDESMLSARTVRYALTALGEAGLITESVYLPDARQSLYDLVEDASHPSMDGPSQSASSTVATSND